MAKHPRYLEIAGALRQDIRKGRLPVGTTLPSENELCARFDASRNTVRAGIAELRREGMVHSRQGAGSIVAAAQPVSVDQSIGSLTDLLRYPAGTRLRLVATTEIPEPSDPPSAWDGGWLCAACKRVVDCSGEVIAWSDIYVPRPFAEAIDLIGHDETPAHRLLERVSGLRIESWEMDFSASVIDGLKARHLSVKPGTLSVDLVRRYFDRHGRLLGYSVSNHPPNKFRFRLQSKRAAQELEVLEP